MGIFSLQFTATQSCETANNYSSHQEINAHTARYWTLS